MALRLEVVITVGIVHIGPCGVFSIDLLIVEVILGWWVKSLEVFLELVVTVERIAIGIEHDPEMNWLLKQS